MTVGCAAPSTRFVNATTTRFCNCRCCAHSALPAWPSPRLLGPTLSMDAGHTAALRGPTCLPSSPLSKPLGGRGVALLKHSGRKGGRRTSHTTGLSQRAFRLCRTHAALHTHAFRPTILPVASNTFTAFAARWHAFLLCRAFLPPHYAFCLAT